MRQFLFSACIAITVFGTACDDKGENPQLKKVEEKTGGKTSALRQATEFSRLEIDGDEQGSIEFYLSKSTDKSLTPAFLIHSRTKTVVVEFSLLVDDSKDLKNQLHFKCKKTLFKGAPMLFQLPDSSAKELERLREEFETVERKPGGFGSMRFHDTLKIRIDSEIRK